MQIQRVSRCAGDRRQVAMRCANCGWQAARIMDADEVGQLERDAARDRELIARDVEILARALPVELPEVG
jgi:hypothetical protein